MLLFSALLLVGVAPSPGLADPTRVLPPPTGWQPDVSIVVRYASPVGGPVLRGFDPPTTRFSTGHRGVDLDAPVGASVRAAADGRVAFAGPVAGTVWVSIAHADGVITSYGPIGSLRVGRGQRVLRGATIGSLAAGGHGDGDRGLHWGARRSGSYLDPLSLLDRGVARPSLAGDGGWRAIDHAVTPYEPWRGGRWGGTGYHRSPTADRRGFAVPPNGNHLVLVAGLGSSSSTMLFDPQHLGYDLRSVTSLSYAGRVEPPGAADDPRRDQAPYGPAETWEGVEAAALRLRDQLRAQAAREPGRAVDLVGHSMGGVVIAYYLGHLHDAYDPSLPAVGHAVTIASPLVGSDLASLVTDVRAHRVYGPLLGRVHGHLARSDGRVGRHVGALPLDGPAVEDLAVASPLLADLAGGLAAAVEEPTSGPLAMGTRVLTIGGGTDLVVGAGRAALPVEVETRADDAPDLAHRVLPGGHAGVLETEALREVVWRFLAGDDVVDSPGHASVGATRIAGYLTRYAGWRLEVSDGMAAPLVPRSRPP